MYPYVVSLSCALFRRYENVQKKLSYIVQGDPKSPINWISTKRPITHYDGCWVSFLGIKQPRHSAERPPHLAPRLKKENGYTSTTPLGLHGPF